MTELVSNTSKPTPESAFVSTSRYCPFEKGRISQSHWRVVPPQRSPTGATSPPKANSHRLAHLTVNQTQSPVQSWLNAALQWLRLPKQSLIHQWHISRLQEAIWGSGSVFPTGIPPPHTSQLELQSLLLCLGLSSASPGDAHCLGESLPPETQAEVPPDPTGEPREHLGELSVFLFWGQGTINFPRIPQTALNRGNCTSARKMLILLHSSYNKSNIQTQHSNYSSLDWNWCWSWNSKYFDHLMQRTDSLEKTLMLGTMRWLNGITDSMGMNLSKLWGTMKDRQWKRQWRTGVLQSMGLQRVWYNWVTELNWGWNKWRLGSWKDRPGFESWLHHLLAVWPWKSLLTSLSFSVFTCKMVTLTASLSQKKPENSTI